MAIATWTNHIVPQCVCMAIAMRRWPQSDQDCPGSARSMTSVPSRTSAAGSSTSAAHMPSDALRRARSGRGSYGWPANPSNRRQLTAPRLIVMPASISQRAAQARTLAAGSPPAIWAAYRFGLESGLPAGRGFGAGSRDDELELTIGHVTILAPSNAKKRCRPRRPDARGAARRPALSHRYRGSAARARLGYHLRR